MHDDRRIRAHRAPALFVPLIVASCARLPPEPAPWPSLQPPPPPVARRDIAAPSGPEPLEPGEPAPAHLGTPASSRAAAPRGWLDATGGYAPQPPDARRIFERSGEAGGTTPDGEMSGLACRISVPGYRGLLGRAPDLRVDATFVEGRERFHVRASAPPDATEIIFSIPLVVPKKGDVFAFDVTDEFLEPRRLSELRVTFDGTVPMAFEGRVSRTSLSIGSSTWLSKGDRASGECRRVPRSVVEGELARARRPVDASLAALDATQPRLEKAAFGLGPRHDGGADAAFSEIQKLAGVVGWDDPRVASRVAHVNAAIDRLRAELAARVKEAMKSLPPPVSGPTPMTGGTLALHPMRLDCGDHVETRYTPSGDRATGEALDKARCVLRLEVQNRGSQNQYIAAGDELTIASSNGRAFRLRPFGELRDDQPIPVTPGRSMKLAAGATTVVLAYPESSERKDIVPPLVVRATIKPLGTVLLRVD